MDAVDRALVRELRADGRATVSELAKAVGLTAGPVSRRIERLEREGVIRGYVALIDDTRAGSLEAFTEVRLVGGVDTAELSTLLKDVPEVEEYFTIAGDPDALLRIRVDDVDHLQRVVNALRRTGKLVGTKTLIVMDSWRRQQDA